MFKIHTTVSRNRSNTGVAIQVPGGPQLTGLFPKASLCMETVPVDDDILLLLCCVHGPGGSSGRRRSVGMGI